MKRPIFQRRHYEAVAAVLVETQERIESNAKLTTVRESHLDEQLRGVRRAAAHFAAAFTEDNALFDAGRFLTACGYGATTMNPRDPALDLRPLARREG